MAADLTNTQFGNLTALIRVSGSPQYLWECRCSCGSTKSVAACNLTSGQTKSCGCLQRQLLSERRKTHGMSNTAVYAVWRTMKARCIDPRSKNFSKYGGAGISVCSRWIVSFEDFSSDMGPRPTGGTIERRDNNLGYSPSNCYWADRTAQARNRSNTLKITFQGEERKVADLVEEFGLRYDSFYHYLKTTGSADLAVTRARRQARVTTS